MGFPNIQVLSSSSESYRDCLSSSVWKPFSNCKMQEFLITLKQKLVNFFCESPESSIFGFVGHMIIVRTTHLCHCSAKAAVDNT